MDKKYFQEDYSIEKFLAKFEQKPDLENLRKELKVYANELHTSMTDILKTETEAIVNLAEHLTNLSSRVSELSSPIFQLHEEIKTLYSFIKSAEESLETYLNKAKIINKKRDNLNMQLNMKTTSLYVNNILYNKLNTDLSDLAVLERAVNEFSFQSTYLHELYSGDIKIDDASIRIERTLKSLVDEVFILSLTRKIHQSILCCLRTYVSLNQQRQAELIYSEKIIEPVLSKIFTNKNLERHNHNLNLLYSEALQFLNSDVKSLVDLVRTNSGLKDFNFIVNSYWKIANKLLQDNLPHITAPGNPELFQKRFQDTWEFLTTIAGKVDPSLIYEESFQEHMKRFNLPVYFEIRFQQISASFETDIIENSFQTTNEHGFLKLKVSVACWRSIQHCFHPEVFLAHLSDQFIKLSLLLLSRYLYYVDAAIKNEQQPMKEEYIVHLILDMGNLKKLLGLQREGDVSRSIYKIVPKDLWIFIEQIIKSNDKLLDTASEKLTNYLIDYKVEQSATLLQQISAIPRLYRRTNKFAPTEESNYIRNVVLPLENFHKNNQALLTSNIDNIMDRCVNKISQQYMTLVEEVLRSVCKTEESLRRLKSRNVSTMDDPSAKSDLTSDEAKIREQIKLDVKYFVTHMAPFVSEKGKSALNTLVKESGCSL